MGLKLCWLIFVGNHGPPGTFRLKVTPFLHFFPSLNFNRHGVFGPMFAEALYRSLGYQYLEEVVAMELEQPQWFFAKGAGKEKSSVMGGVPPLKLPACSCFEPSCPVCQQSTSQPSPPPLTDGPPKTTKNTCSCFAPGCPDCVSPTDTTSQPKKKRRRVLDGEGGRWKRALKEDLLEDALRDCDFEEEHKVLVALPRAVTQSALQLSGRPAGERWLFVELLCGSGNLTSAVLRKAPPGAVVGPGVDSKEIGSTIGDPDSLPRLRIDLTSSAGQTLVMALLCETEPEWVHAAPDCRYWTQLGRLTARRKIEEWKSLQEDATAQVSFAAHVCDEQDRQGRAASFEQPKRAASWEVKEVKHLLTGRFQRFVFPSCAWGMICPDSGRPIQKCQGFMSNRNLQSLLRPCVCQGTRRTKHARLEGHFSGRHSAHGLRKTVWSGQYPQQLCKELAALILANHEQ